MRIVIEIDGLDVPASVRTGATAPAHDRASPAAPGAAAAGGAAAPSAPSAPTASRQDTDDARASDGRHAGGGRPSDAAGARDGGAAPTLGAFGGGIGPMMSAAGDASRERGAGAAPQAGVGPGPATSVDRSGGPAPADLVGMVMESDEQPADQSQNPPDDLSGGAYGRGSGQGEGTDR